MKVEVTGIELMLEDGTKIPLTVDAARILMDRLKKLFGEKTFSPPTIAPLWIEREVFRPSCPNPDPYPLPGTTPCNPYWPYYVGDIPPNHPQYPIVTCQVKED